jgi:hypothetical protein
VAGLLAEAGEGFRGAARGLRVLAGAAGAVDLAAPVDVDEEGAVVDRLLGCRPPAVAGDIAGRHGDQVRGDPQVLQRAGDPAGAQQVDLDGAVER